MDNACQIDATYRSWNNSATKAVLPTRNDHTTRELVLTLHFV
jgi:hypothetical protein